MVLMSLSGLSLGIMHPVDSDSDSELESLVDEPVEQPMTTGYLSPAMCYNQNERRKSSVVQTLRQMSKIRKSMAIVDEEDEFSDDDFSQMSGRLPRLEESVPLMKISSGIT